MTFGDASRSCRALASFLTDVGTTSADMDMVVSLNRLAQRLHELRIERMGQAEITSFFAPQQTNLEQFASQEGATAAMQIHS